MCCIFNTARLTLIILALAHAGLNAQIASAPAAEESVTTTSRTANVPPQGTAAPQLQDLRIGTGDLLEITMFGTQDFNREVRVSSSGDISVPPLGLVHVAGLTTTEAERLIERELAEGGFYREPRVSVFQKEYVTQGVSLLGEVNKPGVYPLLGDRHLFDLLSQAGGLTPNAAKIVSITHAGQSKPTIVTLSKDRDLDSGSNVTILPGDTIAVATAGVVYVIGDVNKPGGFVMNDQNLTVLQALALAGGNTATASLDRAQIIRQINGIRQEVPIALKRILDGRDRDVSLRAEDVLFIPNSKGKSAAARSIQAIMQAAVGVAIYRR